MRKVMQTAKLRDSVQILPSDFAAKSDGFLKHNQETALLTKLDLYFMINLSMEAGVPQHQGQLHDSLKMLGQTGGCLRYDTETCCLGRRECYAACCCG